MKLIELTRQPAGFEHVYRCDNRDARKALGNKIAATANRGGGKVELTSINGFTAQGSDPVYLLHVVVEEPAGKLRQTKTPQKEKVTADDDFLS